MQEFYIDVSPNGDVRVEGKNISGPDCKTLTAEIEKALGTTTSSKLKPEYHQARQATITRKA